jgi:hypothetical protein
MTPVERPQEAFASPNASATIAEGSGRSGHPLHFPGQAVMADIARAPEAYVSVGYVSPGWHPVAWTSPDAERWPIHRLGETDYTFMVALAVGADGTIVAVGRSGPHPIAWTTRDGAAWTEHVVPVLGITGVAERMTTVVAAPGGFLAGGSIGPETGSRHVRFWRSADGATWNPVPDDAIGFADAEARSIVRTASGFVAVGLLGTAGHPTGSVAWTSHDGERWTRVDDADLRTGQTASLVVGPGGGLVAVGTDLERREAVVWTSSDGGAWTRAPGEDSRRFGGFIQMTDVTLAGRTLVAVGESSSLQRPTVMAWTSADGIRWTAAKEVPAFEQSEAYGIAAGPVPSIAGSQSPGVVAVGAFGIPDDYIPTAWLSPAQ